MYGLKYEHPQAQPNFTRSYKKKSVNVLITFVAKGTPEETKS